MAPDHFRPVSGIHSPWIGGLVATPLIILLMTYLVMPLMTRMFSPWLFTKSEEVNP